MTSTSTTGTNFTSETSSGGQSQAAQDVTQQQQQQQHQPQQQKAQPIMYSSGAVPMVPMYFFYNALISFKSLKIKTFFVLQKVAKYLVFTRQMMQAAQVQNADGSLSMVLIPANQTVHFFYIKI